MEEFLEIVLWDIEHLPRCILLGCYDTMKSYSFQLGFDFLESGKCFIGRDVVNMVAVERGKYRFGPKNSCTKIL